MFRAMTKQQEATLDDLLRLAKGDGDMVAWALRQADGDIRTAVWLILGNSRRCMPSPSA